ncbi:MAG TPA: hypothetical protein ENJ79_10605 [Gammaproteobacteria bacterium]|nr:hypothetical protein [Gammaproteobacteria bacterium]
MLGLLVQAGVSGCNGDADDETLPPGTTVLIQPAGREFRLGSELRDAAGNCQYGVVFQDIPVLVSVLRSDGAQISEAPLRFALDFSGNTFTGQPVLQLYDDRNGNGIAEPGELVSDFDDPLYRTRTEAFSGEKLMLVRVDLACTFEGTLTVVSGAFLSEMTIQVTLGGGAGGTP